MKTPYIVADRHLVTHFWHLGCHTSAVPEDKNYLVLTLLDLQVVIYNREGEIISFVNECPHRGARLFSDVSGRSIIKCPYHGWIFAKAKTYVPSLDTFNDSPSDPQHASLRYCRTIVFHGLVFFSVSPVVDFYSQFDPPTLDILNSVGSSIALLSASHHAVFPSNWRLAVENSLEAYHVSQVHSQSLGRLKPDCGTNTFFTWSSLLVHTIGNTRILKSLYHATRYLDISASLPSSYYSLYLFPFSSISSTASVGFSFQSYFPHTNQDLANFCTSLYAPKLLDQGMPADDHPLKSFFTSSFELNKQVFEEDMSISALVPLSSWDIMPMKFSSSMEEKILHFRKTYLNSLSYLP